MPGDRAQPLAQLVGAGGVQLPAVVDLADMRWASSTLLNRCASAGPQGVQGSCHAHVRDMTEIGVSVVAASLGMTIQVKFEHATPALGESGSRGGAPLHRKRSRCRSAYLIPAVLNGHPGDEGGLRASTPEAVRGRGAVMPASSRTSVVQRAMRSSVRPLI